MPSTKIPLKVQKRSGFDWSHHSAFSQKVGIITPLFVNEVIPNSKIFLRYALAGSMPPLSTDAYVKCYYDVRAFFVPMRLLYGGFESWFTDYPYQTITRSNLDNRVQSAKAFMPYFSIDYNDAHRFIGANTLSDYLGYMADTADIASADQNIVISAMPFLAYHRLCDDWFRQPNITVSKFGRPDSTLTVYVDPAHDYFVSMCPFVSMSSAGREIIPVSYTGTSVSPNCLFADGSSIFGFCRANYDYDYFTNALPSAQLGTPMSVASASSFSIAALRSANSLQQFAELNMLAGSNLVSSVKARYGANLHDSIAQRSVYLGGARIDIANKSVDVTTNTQSGYTANPFITSPGSSGGKVYAQGSDILIDDFVVNEPGYIFVVGVVVPKVTYSSGIRRYLRHYIGSGSIVDMANPLLQNVGNQPIYQYELNGSLLGHAGADINIFGYTDRYAEMMTMEDECHGLMRKGETLESFVAQRSWSGTQAPVIGTNFLEIPNDAIDNISAVNQQLSQYGFYGQAAFDCKVSMPLAQYSLPSLQNPAYEHGKTVVVHRGGFRF